MGTILEGVPGQAFPGGPYGPCTVFHSFPCLVKELGVKAASKADKNIGSGVRLLWFYHLLACGPGQANSHLRKMGLITNDTPGWFKVKQFL